jgi:hypothetical protein
MESALADLWNGVIRPKENLSPNTPEFLDICQKLNNDSAYIKSVLSAEDNLRFDSYEETSDAISDVHNEQAFIKGFRYAALIMAEVYGSKDLMPELLKMLNSGK